MKKKYRKRKLPKYFFIISLALFLFVGIGYSVINSNLTMQGNVVRKATSWSIGFSNPVFDTGSKTSPTPTITNGTTMTMNVNLTSPGEKYAFTVDLTNNGNVPALINTLNITELTEEQKVYLRWKVEYEDESPLEVGDLLKAGETKKVHIYLEYKNLRAKDLYPSAPINLNLSVQANFYLPEETFNTVTVTKNESTKLVQVSNLIQEATLDDFPIESDDQVIACNNGVEPSTDTNNKIVLSKVKQNATCRIESSLANAVTNSGTEVSNIAILQDATTNTRLTVQANQTINLNLNKKTYTFTTGNDSSQIIVAGVLNINDTNKEGELKTTQLALVEYTENSSGIIKNSKLTRSNANGIGSTIRAGGNMLIFDSIIKSDTSCAVSTYNNNQQINIENSTIQSNGNLAIIVTRINSVFNIKNSILQVSYNIAIGPNVDTAVDSKVYLCNNTITSNKYDFRNYIPTLEYYYYNTTFRNSTKTPILTNPENNNAYQTELACAE